jgi:hypothetical protein
MGNENDEFDQEDSAFGAVTDSIKRAVGGLSTMLTSEESLRSTLGDLPKEAISYLVNQTERTRDDLKRTISNEVKTFLAERDLATELREALKGLTIEVTAQVRFKEDGSIDADVSGGVTEPVEAADSEEAEKDPSAS